MINKYFRLVKEQEDLESEIESKVRSLVKDETGQTIIVMFYTRSVDISSMQFSSSFNEDGTRSTTPRCTTTAMPDTLESALEKTEEMFKAKKDWERLLVKIDEVLSE